MDKRSAGDEADLTDKGPEKHVVVEIGDKQGLR